MDEKYKSVMKRVEKVKCTKYLNMWAENECVTSKTGESVQIVFPRKHQTY